MADAEVELSASAWAIPVIEVIMRGVMSCSGDHFVHATHTGGHDIDAFRWCHWDPNPAISWLDVACCGQIRTSEPHDGGTASYSAGPIVNLVRPSPDLAAVRSDWVRLA